MALEYPDNELGLISEEILGLTARQAVAISTNGWENLSDFADYDTKSIEDWMKSTARLAVNRGGVTFPQVRAKRVFALAHWVNSRLLQGLQVPAGDFDAGTLAESMADYPIADMQKAANDTAKMPDLFSYEKWVEWQDSVVTFMKGTKNVNKNVPLYYVLRPAVNPMDAEDMTNVDRIIYHAPHQGAAYQVDNRAVHSYLTELTNGTDADQWIKQHRRGQNGRAAWLALLNHYDGPAEGDKRVTVARSDINIIHYRNESSYSFEKYSTRLRKAFFTLEQYQQPKCEREKVEILLNQISTNDQRLISSVAICRDSHADTFDNACTYLSQQIAMIFPQHQPNAFGRVGRGGRRNRARNVSGIKRSRGGKQIINGIDITDTCKYYSPKEYNKMGQEGRRILSDCPKRQAERNKRSNSKRSKQHAGREESQVAAVINGVMNATRNMSIASSTVTPPAMPQHGPHAKTKTVASVESGQSVISQVTFDHHGNIL
jgi:hypothetical protein